MQIIESCRRWRIETATISFTTISFTVWGWCKRSRTLESWRNVRKCWWIHKVIIVRWWWQVLVRWKRSLVWQWNTWRRNRRYLVGSTHFITIIPMFAAVTVPMAILVFSVARTKSGILLRGRKPVINKCILIGLIRFVLFHKLNFLPIKYRLFHN